MAHSSPTAKHQAENFANFPNPSSPSPKDPREATVEHLSTMGSLIKIGKKTKRISLQRFLLTKLVIEPTRFRLSDWVCLYENQLWLERKCLQDQNFFRKFSDDVFTTSYLMKESDLKGLLQSSKTKFSLRIKNNLSSFLVPARNYTQWKKRFSGRFSFHPEVLDKELKDFYSSRKPKPKRSIGIGYRDKGSRRNLAKDGSPDWRDVASISPPSFDYVKEIQDAKDFKDIERVFVKCFPDQDWSAYFAGKNSSVFASNPETTFGAKTKG
jgi:hypothetical protein